MNRAVRASVAALFIACFPAFVSTWDYGLGFSDQSSMVVEDDFNATQSNRARAWFSSPFPAGMRLDLSGFYDFRGTYSTADTGSEIVPLRLDVDRLELAGTFADLLTNSSVLRYSVGRADVSDFSGRVISGPSDGAHAEFALGNSTYRAWGGYRGLLYKEDARSFLDIDDDSNYSDDDEYFAPSRAFIGVGARFAELLGAQDAGAELWAQVDLGSGSTKTNTVYFEPYLEGRLGRLFRWRAWTVAEAGSDGDAFFAMAAGTMLRLSVPELKGFRLTQTMSWASGSDGNFKAFTPLRQGPVGSASPFSFSDILSVGMDASFSPVRHLSAKAGGSALYRSSDNPPSGGGLRDDAVGKFLGLEVSSGASLRVASDATLDFSCGMFAPNTSDMYPEGTKIRWTASLSASLEI
ncbi:MAG TPA: hypothetical protein DIC34_13300 [Treponema sp.]|nr:MAG: hypothetical protein A2Y36_04500 [Treponema sp. GWA1_62_8]OHE67405.1 MAG: hypothetical protein A2001_07300 [Treponema sp. GWC1_61_84]OHE69376.1 MAG: hypothetical protein A2413_08720 [Treponema sp. RIFOXYC1_FULL_61_9]HCM27499.1 hypothetical protein [Treponema sp.]